MRAALSVVLSGKGYQVASFIEGETLLAAARFRTPGCVLLDVRLPGCSGFDILKQLDAQSYPAPVLVLAVRKRNPIWSSCRAEDRFLCFLLSA